MLLGRVSPWHPLSNSPGIGGVSADVAERAANHVEPVSPVIPKQSRFEIQVPDALAMDGTRVRPATYESKAYNASWHAAVLQRRHLKAASSPLDDVFWSTG